MWAVFSWFAAVRAGRRHFLPDFEAPQSLRSIAALPAVVYFIGLSLNCLWTEWVWAARVKSPRLSLIPAMAVLVAIALSNGMTYFGRQAADIGVCRPSQPLRHWWPKT